MGAEVLTAAELNRATLARQLLLERSAVPVPEAVRRLAGLQAQVVAPPFVGLWTRLRDFERSVLIDALEQGQVVRATAMRSTVHLLEAGDYRRWRLALQPAMLRALYGFNGERARRLDLDAVVAAARELVKEQPRSRGELISGLGELWPDESPEAMAYAAQAHLPLVQVPGAGPWGFAQAPPYALFSPRPAKPDLSALVRRYLTAFGPASVKDFQAWSGLTRTRPVFESLRHDLSLFVDESGIELFDLPGAPRPAADTPAPPRYLADYDNLILSHHDRTRVLPEAHRKGVLTGAGVVRAAILVDGRVAGVWKLERPRRREVVVRVERFTALPAGVRRLLAEEGELLARFLAPEAESAGVSFA